MADIRDQLDDKYRNILFERFMKETKEEEYEDVLNDMVDKKKKNKEFSMKVKKKLQTVRDSDVGKGFDKVSKSIADSKVVKGTASALNKAGDKVVHAKVGKDGKELQDVAKSAATKVREIPENAKKKSKEINQKIGNTAVSIGMSPENGKKLVKVLNTGTGAIIDTADVAVGVGAIAAFSAVPGPGPAAVYAANLQKHKEPVKALVKTIEPVNQSLSKVVQNVADFTGTMKFALKYNNRLKEYNKDIKDKIDEIEAYYNKKEGNPKTVTNKIRSLQLEYKAMLRTYKKFQQQAQKLADGEQPESPSEAIQESVDPVSLVSKVKFALYEKDENFDPFSLIEEYIESHDFFYDDTEVIEACNLICEDSIEDEKKNWE